MLLHASCVILIKRFTVAVVTSEEVELRNICFVSHIYCHDYSLISNSTPLMCPHYASLACACYANYNRHPAYSMMIVSKWQNQTYVQRTHLQLLNLESSKFMIWIGYIYKENRKNVNQIIYKLWKLLRCPDSDYSVSNILVVADFISISSFSVCILYQNFVCILVVNSAFYTCSYGLLGVEGTK